jgi:hypothetical protein
MLLSFLHHETMRAPGPNTQCSQLQPQTTDVKTENKVTNSEATWTSLDRS